MHHMAKKILGLGENQEITMRKDYEIIDYKDGKIFLSAPFAPAFNYNFEAEKELVTDIFHVFQDDEHTSFVAPKNAEFLGTAHRWHVYREVKP